jgi:acetyl-CoA C-acetyltransferase
VVVVSACRTAVGTFGGSLRDLNCAALGSIVMREAVKRAGIEAALLDDVRFGCCMEPEDALNVTRISALMAGIPETVTAVTVNRDCISGMEAVVSGMAMIQAGMADIILAGGMEHMSGSPILSPPPAGAPLPDQALWTTSSTASMPVLHLLPAWRRGRSRRGRCGALPGQALHHGGHGGTGRQIHNLSREEIDEVALRTTTTPSGPPARGLPGGDRPVQVPQKKGKPPVIFEKDEHFRPGLTMADLAALPAAFVPKIGKVTAGNSSGVNDGASAMVIMSAAKARELGIPPLARIRAVGPGGCPRPSWA